MILCDDICYLYSVICNLDVFTISEGRKSLLIMPSGVKITNEVSNLCSVIYDPNGVTRSSNRSVIPELAEGSPADKRSHSSPPTDPNDPNGVAQPHKYKNSPKNKKFCLKGRTFFNSKTSYNNLIIKIIQIISCL